MLHSVNIILKYLLKNIHTFAHSRQVGCFMQSYEGCIGVHFRP